MQCGQMFATHDRQAWPQETQGGVGGEGAGELKGKAPWQGGPPSPESDERLLVSC